MKVTGIYALIDPLDQQIKYVGLSLDIHKRYREHFNKKQLESKTLKNNWLKKLIKLNLKPELYIVEECKSDSLKENEVFWIGYFKSIGCRLKNHTLGGDGLSGYNHTLESKNKISIKRKGMIFSEEHNKNISKGKTGGIPWNKGKVCPQLSTPKGKMSEERLTAHKIRMKEVMNNPEVRANMSAAHIGKPPGNKGKKSSPEKIAKIKEKNKLRAIKIVDSNGKHYESLLDASKQLGCTPTDVRRCILNPDKRIKGLGFTRV